jgi:tape measure domain-containing protein
MAAENNIVGEVGLIVKPVDPGFNAGVQRIIDKMERDAQIKVAADTKEAEKNVRQLGDEVTGLNNKLVEAAINVGGVTAAFFALRGAVNKTLSTFSGLFDQLAQARAGFTSILKSEAAGGQLLDDIREFARVSPFVTQELVNYSQQLLGVGLSAEKIVPLLEDVGNIISSVGGDTQTIGRVLFTLTQIQSIGRLAGQDALQLQSALIPITKYLSEFLGKTTAEVKKLQEQGKISAETVFQAISIQGDKVQGAMANATRNIAGARAILSDTITILLQEQPVLQEIFEDIFRSILKFADYLGTPEVRTAIDAFFVQVGKVYEAVKPLGEALASLGGSSGLTSLNVLTTLLSTLATVLSAIPEPVLKAVAATFISLSALKAPLILVQYVVSLKDLSVRALQSSVTLRKTTTDIEAQGAAAAKAANANYALATSMTAVANSETAVARAGIVSRINNSRPGSFLQRNSRVAGTAGAVGLGAAGALLADGEGGARDALGTVATTAALGGAVAGPWGIAAGAAIGSIAAIVTASRKASDEIKKQAAAARDAWALDVTGAIEDAFGVDVNSTSLTEYFNEIGKVNRRILEYRKLASDARAKAADTDIFNPRESQAFSQQAIAQAERFSDAAKDADKDLDALLNDPKYSEFLRGASSNIALLAEANKDLFRVQGPVTGRFIQFNDVLKGQDIPKNAAEFNQLEQVLAQMGLTIADVGLKTREELQGMIDVFTRLPNAIRDAERAAQEWNKRYTDAAAAAALFTDEQVKQISTQIGFQNAISSTLGSVTKAAEDQTSLVAQLTADSASLTLAAQAYSQANTNGASVVQSFQAREEALRLTQIARAEAQATISAQTQIQNEARILELLQLAGLADTLDNREIVLEVAANGIADVQKQINDLITQILTLQTTIPLTSGGARYRANKELRDLQGQLTDLQGEAERVAGGSQDSALAQEAKKIAEARAAEQARRDAENAAERAKSAAESAANEALRAAEEYARNIESSTNSLTQALEQAAESIRESAQQWIGSIKERTQFEQSVSASRLISNTQRQTADLTELTSGIDTLRARGLSQEVLDALGINNVSDLRQVRKLIGASDTELATLSQSVGGLNAAAIDLATREQDKRTKENITQAILDAAKTLGLDVTSGQASSISNQFNINANTNPEEVALQILSALTSGRIG